MTNLLSTSARTRTSVTTRVPHVASLFSGAGGLDLGLIHAGANVVWANDIDRDACETYAANIGQHIICADVYDIDFSQIPEVDIIVGGFPCQGFSHANLLRSKDDIRNTLYRELLRCIKTVRPRVFLAENVRGILNLDKGAALAEILNDFRDAGYSTTYHVVNAADYGVPQNRWRVFFVGIRADLTGTFVPPLPTHVNPEKLGPSSQLLPWISIKDALSEIPEPDAPHFLLNHIGSKYKVSDRNFTGHRRTDPTKPSPTILARGNGKGGVCAIQHPDNHRRLTVRESAIIQTFPLDFEFHGGLMSMYRQVGNAVPMRLAEAFGRSIVALEAQL